MGLLEADRASLFFSSVPRWLHRAHPAAGSRSAESAPGKSALWCAGRQASLRLGAQDSRAACRDIGGCPRACAHVTRPSAQTRASRSLQEASQRLADDLGGGGAFGLGSLEELVAQLGIQSD